MQIRRSMRVEMSGFTLLELMITVAVVAILATIAYASYQDQIVKSRRATAAACLQERAQFMERFYTTNLSYLDSAGAAPAISQCDNEISPYYQVGLAAGTTARAFTLQAVPQGVQATRDTKCATLTLNQLGARGVKDGSASATPEVCW